MRFRRQHYTEFIELKTGETFVIYNINCVNYLEGEIFMKIANKNDDSSELEDYAVSLKTGKAEIMAPSEKVVIMSTELFIY